MVRTCHNTWRELLLQRERWVQSKHVYLIHGSVGAYPPAGGYLYIKKGVLVLLRSYPTRPGVEQVRTD